LNVGMTIVILGGIYFTSTNLIAMWSLNELQSIV